MRVHAYCKRDDGSLDMTNPIIVDSSNIPDGLFLADEGKVYDTDGYEIDLPEPTPQEPSLEERIQALEVIELERILEG